MNKQQYLLTKLAEECAEVIQDALKTQQFGTKEVRPDLPPHMTNQHRLAMEIADLLSVIKLLSLEGVNVSYLFTEEWFQAKAAKIDKYYKKSQELGMVDEEVSCGV